MAARAGLLAAAILLGLHGLVHVLGTVVYWQLAEVQGFEFKTTVLNDGVDLGTYGIRVFGALWLAPAIGFAAAGLGLWSGSNDWLRVLLASTLISLVLTSLDWEVAYAGIAVDVAILLLAAVGTTGWVRF